MVAETQKSPAYKSSQQHTPSAAKQTARALKPFQAFLTKFTNDWSMNLAAGLAYNLIMAIFPLVIAVMAMLGFIVGNFEPALYTSLTHQVANVFPSVSSSQNLVISALRQLEKDSGILGILAIILAIFNGSRLFVFMEGCLDIIYQVRPRKVIPQNVIAILMVLLFVILIPIMVIASVVPTLMFSILQKTSFGLVPGSSILFSFGGILGGLIASYILFQVIYIVVPNQKKAFSSQLARVSGSSNTTGNVSCALSTLCRSLFRCICRRNQFSYSSPLLLLLCGSSFAGGRSERLPQWST